MQFVCYFFLKTKERIKSAVYAMPTQIPYWARNHYYFATVLFIMSLFCVRKKSNTPS